MASRPRSNSMTDALRMRQWITGMPGSQALRLPNTPVARSTSTDHLEQFISNLPKLTEQDIIALDLRDSSCPICITPYMALLSEEETAIAMDSPAHPVEELGVTKLHQSCGHVFCRKDIRNWVMQQGKNTCPTCRRPFIDEEHLPNPGIVTIDGATLIDPDSLAVLRDEGFAFILPQDVPPLTDLPRNDDNQDRDHDQDRNEYAGMYS